MSHLFLGLMLAELKVNKKSCRINGGASRLGQKPASELSTGKGNL